MKKIFFYASLKSMKEGVGSGVGSGSVCQRYGSGDPEPDPDPHQIVTDPQHCCKDIFKVTVGSGSGATFTSKRKVRIRTHLLSQQIFCLAATCLKEVLHKSSYDVITFFSFYTLTRERKDTADYQHSVT
jgi:hypothetical protein